MSDGLDASGGSVVIGAPVEDSGAGGADGSTQGDGETRDPSEGGAPDAGGGDGGGDSGGNPDAGDAGRPDAGDSGPGGSGGGEPDAGESDGSSGTCTLVCGGTCCASGTACCTALLSDAGVAASVCPGTSGAVCGL